MSEKFDLIERIAKFGENIIDLSKKLPKTTTNRSLVDQLIRAGTSIGANYMEADVLSLKRILGTKLHYPRKKLRRRPIG